MDAHVRKPVTQGAWLLSLCLACLIVLTPAVAQLGALENPPQPGEPDLQLDIDALLEDDRVFEESISSVVWQLSALPGRRLVQVPVMVEAKGEDTRLATPSLRLRGGRFIAWRIVLDEQQGGGQFGGAYQDPYSNPTSIGALGGYGSSASGALDPASVGATGGVEPGAEALEERLPEDVPVLARDVRISPSGVVHWDLERAIPGAEVKSGSTGYLLKLRPDRLAELEPERPERSRATGGRTNGQDAREEAARRRAEELEYRDKVTAYRELRDQIRELPDEFRAPLPSRLWAIYEVSDRLEELSFTGEPPMPWRIAITDIEALKQIDTGTGRGGDLTAADYTAVSQMSLMIADQHPLTQRAVASTLSNADMLGRSEQGDALYRLIDQLLKSKDANTVRTTTAGLAASLPPSPATLSLLKGAFDEMDPASKLLALGGLLASQGNDPVSQRQMIDTANRMIADPDGPGVVYVLDELTRALADNPDAMQLIGNGIRFEALSPEALDKAIVYTADAAGQSVLAAEWMEHGLLGSADTRVVRRTVELLGTSAPGGGVISATVKAIVIATFGPANPDLASRSKPPLRGIARIPIGTANHSIYRVLNAGDPELRAMGWKALRHFQITGAQSGGYTGGQPDNSEEPDRLTLILDAAFGQTVTPPQLIAFLVNQELQGPATAALVRVVVEGRGPAITQAARALVGSGRQIDQTVQALDPEQRGAFASRLYESVSGSSPMVTGLMRISDGRSPIVSWFTKEVTTGGLPVSEKWAQAFQGEDQLLTLAGNSDPQIAEAAVAALVASIGGDETTARDLARRMSNATDRSAIGLREMWSDAKRELYASKLKSAAGQYRLVVNLRSDTATQTTFGTGFGQTGGGYSGLEYDDASSSNMDPDAIARAPMIRSIRVALIELKADGTSIRLASGTLTISASDSRLAIAVLDPKELKDFGNSELNELPLDEIEGSIDLLPKRGGAWSGGTGLGDGRIIEIVFDPV